MEIKHKQIILLLLVLGLSINGMAQDFVSNQEMPCEMENAHFDVGEKLVYKVYYNWGLIWIAAGEVSFEVKQDGTDYHYVVEGTTYPRYDSFFKVRDYFESKSDMETMLPSHFKRQVHEGNYIRYDSISFNQEEYKVKEYFGKTKEEAKEYNFNLNHCSHDLLSIIYFLRNIDLSALDPGDALPMDVFFDKELFSLNLNYVEDIEKKSIKELGKYNVKQFQPTLITGNVFTEEAVMSIYISDDENRIPLLIESPVTVGSVKAVLSSHEGLKFPLPIK